MMQVMRGKWCKCCAAGGADGTGQVVQLVRLEQAAPSATVPTPVQTQHAAYYLDSDDDFFDAEDSNELLSYADVRPAVNQFEVHQCNSRVVTVTLSL